MKEIEKIQERIKEVDSEITELLLEVDLELYDGREINEWR